MRGNTVKSKRLLFEGRSMVLNVLFVAMNVFGAVFLLQSFFVDQSASGLFKLAGIGMFLGSAVMLFILRGFYMYAYFARLVIAVVLLISGFGKLNDPVGFAQILEQYFQDGALSLKISQFFGWSDFSLVPYTSWTLKIAISLAVGEILLSLMLLYHLLYKLAVFLLVPLLLIFSFVSFYTSTCNEAATFEHEFNIRANEGNSKDLLDRSQWDDNLTLISKTKDEYHFLEVKNHVCVNECGCLGAKNETFFGMELTPDLAFSRNLMLLLFILILFVTQFWMLPNAAFENTLYGICAWLAILIQGTLTGWFWLVILAAIILYLATNVRRFGVNFLKSSFGALLFVALLLFGILYYVISFEPLSDFRSYAIGTSISNSQIQEYQEPTIVHVYQHKFTNKVIFLKEDMINDSPILSDTNYVFLREKELKMNPFIVEPNYKFRPTISVEEIQKKSIQHPLINPFLEKFAEELYRVKNKATGAEVMLYPNEFSQDMFKDTNLVIEKFIGIHEDFTYIDVGESVVNAPLVFIWVVKDIRKILPEHWEQIRLMTQKAHDQEYDLIVIGYQRSALWYEKSEIDQNVLVFLNLEQSEVNEICRSNVCLMVLKNGVVEAKYPLRGLPLFETISSKLRLE